MQWQLLMQTMLSMAIDQREYMCASSRDNRVQTSIVALVTMYDLILIH